MFIALHSALIVFLEKGRQQSDRDTAKSFGLYFMYLDTKAAAMSLYGVGESECDGGIRHRPRNRGERRRRLWARPMQLELSQYSAMDWSRSRKREKKEKEKINETGFVFV